MTNLKKRLSTICAWLLALAVVLSGVAWSGMRESAWAEEATESKVVAIVNGHEILSDGPRAEYEQYASLYAMYGMDDEETLSELKQDILNMYVYNEVYEQKLTSLDLTQFSGAEIDAATAEATAMYEDMIEQYLPSFEQEGMSEEEVREQVIAYFDSANYTLDLLVASILLSNQVTGDITVSEEEIQAEYESRVAMDQELYGEDLGYYEDAMMNGTMVTYHPAGYRTVKHILLMPDDEKQMELSELSYTLAETDAALEALAEDEDASALMSTKAETERAIQEILDSIKPELEEVLSRLENGEDFIALMDEYGDDPGMQYEPTMSLGYYVSADSPSWMPEFTAAAMALENVGDISEPVWVDYGVHIIRYESDVTPGAVPLEEVRDQLAEEILGLLKDEAFNLAVEEWVAEAEIEYFPENLTA